MAHLENPSQRHNVDAGTISAVAESSLLNAAIRFTELGKDGKASVQKNRFGETALRMDIEAEQIVIETFRAAKVPARIVSEEHGITDLCVNPSLLAVLDGIDGTVVYKSGAPGRFATLLTVFDHIDPKYSDYLYAGMMSHGSAELFAARKGNGVVIQHVAAGSIVSSTPTALSAISALAGATIYVDESFPINERVFSEPLKSLQPKCILSSAHYYTALARGEAELVCECTRKGNLELAAAHALISELGGILCTLDRSPLADARFNSFGQNEHIPVVAAANRQILNAALQLINQRQNIETIN